MDILTLTRLYLFLRFIVNIKLDELEEYAEQVYYIIVLYTTLMLYCYITINITG